MGVISKQFFLSYIFIKQYSALMFQAVILTLVNINILLIKWMIPDGVWQDLFWLE